MPRSFLMLIAAMVPAAAAAPSDCTQTSVGFVPIDDLGAGLYLGQFQGGLYPGGLNTPPPAHGLAGLARAGAIEPMSTEGVPDPEGRYVLLSIGMSNTTQEFCSHEGGEPCDPWTFMGRAAEVLALDATRLRIVNGAKGGQAAAAWDSPDDLNYDRVRDQVLGPLGLTEAQVQAVWIKQANAGPDVSLPNGNADAYVLEALLGDIARAVKVRYPNVKLAFFSSRIYAGYASTALNPEPYAYETGFSAKWLIEAQIDQMNGAGIDPVAGDLSYDTSVPWLGWGPYLWADGLNPRSDGLIWTCQDMQSDGTHPATSGEEKVGSMLLQLFMNSPFTGSWFATSGVPGDLDGDGHVGIADFLMLLASWGPCDPPCPPSCPADLDGDCDVGITDMLTLLASWG